MAYAVLASLFTTTEKMLNPYPYSIPCKRETIESLHNNVAILLSFLENTPSHSYQTIMSLETKIRDVAYETEDILESHIAKHCRSIYESNGTDEADDNIKNMLSQALEEVMKGFESLKEDVKEIQGTSNFGGLLVEQMTSLSVAAGSSRPAASSGKTKFVVLDMDIMNQIKEQLASDESRLKAIPIVGMGGIGKTTLAKALIDDPFTVNRFDIRGWVTISQQYSTQDVVQNLLNDIKVNLKKKKDVVDLNAENDVPKHQTGIREKLHKTLYGRRYLVVLDNLWDIDTCDELQRLFPDWNNGSRIMVTTRQSGVATSAAKSYHEMKLLNDDMSWGLLRQELFAKEGNNCPSKLVEIGKEIAKKCRGLPLTISVIGGLLSKEKMTREHWEHVAVNIKSVLTEKDDQCSEILSLSYHYLPHHLKPCFLYMGIFQGGSNIRVSRLLQFWVAEGFLKPGSTNMEKVAEENLKDLIERNLILIEKLKYNGKPKSCRIHDLLRDLCIREARKEKFLYVWNEHMGFNLEEANGQRRLSILPEHIKDKYNVMHSMPGNRSIICYAYHDYLSKLKFGSELLRVLPPKYYDQVLDEVTELPNLRWLMVQYLETRTGSLISKQWNLQYLFALKNSGSPLPSHIWNMPQIRHLEVVDHSLPPFPARTKEMPACVLKHLEVLCTISNFRCGDRVLERIPNLRKLKIRYDDDDQASDWSYYRLKNLVKLSKLETLNCEFDGIETETLVANLAFPISLKKLSLSGCEISWKHMEIIGVLPNLEILKLHDAFVGPMWETIEDNFKKLEYLLISSLDELNEWIVEDANHFPSLRHLVLQWCNELEEIPTCIGEIPTLEIIELGKYCSDGVVSSAKNIQDEYNNDLKLVINNISRDAYDKDEDDDDSDGNHAS